MVALRALLLFPAALASSQSPDLATTTISPRAVNTSDAAEEALATSQYPPKAASCPSTSLVRPARGVSSAEASWIASRKPIASAALARWLARTGQTFGRPSRYPTLALSTSGGGLRALLAGAGVIQAFDGRDSNVSTSGLYQSLTYESGLSGGSWMLGSIAGNNWPTVTQLKTSLWEQNFQDSLLVPELITASGVSYANIVDDTVAKQLAGYEVTVVDVYGRLLSYALLSGSDGGVADTMYGLSELSNFTSHSVPFPIITAIGVDTAQGQCTAPANGTQYEFSPFEFGSWDSGVSAFASSEYLGSSLNNGKPAGKSCVVDYDNLGYVMGTSSNIFTFLCGGSVPQGANTTLANALEDVVDKAHQAATSDAFALYPNPFFNYSGSPLVAKDQDLSLIDGGLTNQNDPIWPFLHRDVDVLFVSDASADTSDNYPNGSAIYDTYVQARQQGLTKMPVIPPPASFPNPRQPRFFGCHTNSTLTIIYIPNTNYTTNSGTPTAQIQYSKAQTDAIIANGVLVGDYNSSPTWGACVGCAIMAKTGASLPAICGSCFSTLCYN